MKVAAGRLLLAMSNLASPGVSTLVASIPTVLETPKAEKLIFVRLSDVLAKAYIAWR